MSGAGDMLAQARKSIGTGESPPGSNRNYISSWYGLVGPWCDMSVTYWAYHSGNQSSVCPKGKRAYTVWHAQDFQALGRWYEGTSANVSRAKPGDIVFFDWNGSNSVGAIDHVGVVERNLGGGLVQTIEGNTSDVCARRVRDSSTIAGYGRPAYSGAPSAPPVKSYWDVIKGSATVRVPWGSPVLSEGASGQRVRWLQSALNFLGSKLGVDGEFGPNTKAAVAAFQRRHRLGADGEYGPLTARALQGAVKAR